MPSGMGLPYLHGVVMQRREGDAMNGSQGVKRIQTVIIGGGQAGLSVGYYLAKRGLPFVILDANERVGDAWRNRWDSLRLFTPARYNGLAGMRFPAKGDTFPSKDAMADFLETYATRFDLPVMSGVRVDSLSKRSDRFIVSAGDHRFEADHVVIAMANYQTPRVPPFARDLDPSITQLHSSEYKNPAQLKDGGLLIVGAGNSASELGIELARTHKTWMAGKETGHVPFRIETPIARHVLIRIVRFVGQHVLSVGTPIGRKMRPKMLPKAGPLVRVKPKDLLAAGIERVGRVTGVRNGLPVLDDGRELDVTNVVWCTGYNPGFSWVDLPVFGEDGEPVHHSGIVDSEPGLYFVGLFFLHSMTSDTVTGVRRDAERIGKQIASRARRSLASHTERPRAASES
jgi:putative flavoprotein involved in K+ transport